MIEALDGRFVGDLELVHHDGRDSHGGSRLHEGEDDGQRGHDIGALPGDERGRFGTDQRSMLDNPDTRHDRATYSARRLTMRRDISPSLLAFPTVGPYPVAPVLVHPDGIEGRGPAAQIGTATCWEGGGRQV